MAHPPSVGSSEKLHASIEGEAPARSLERALLVPTHLPCALGDRRTLCLSLTRHQRSLEFLVIVVGRRRACGDLLPAGLMVQLVDPALLKIVREVGEGTIFDVWERQQERVLLPARVSFDSREQANDELGGLMEDGAALALRQLSEPVVRGDRLSLDVDVGACRCASLASSCSTESCAPSSWPTTPWATLPPRPCCSNCGARRSRGSPST
jgi:hypothetical protein